MKNTSDTKYTAFTVNEECELLPFLEKALDGISRSKAKAVLGNNGVRIDNRTETQFNFRLTPGMKVEISKHKPGVTLHDKYVKLVYEDHDIIVIDKAPGILSAPAPHHIYNVKTVIDSYLKASHQKCTAHVVHRLDRETSGLMVYAKNIGIEQVFEHEWKDLVTDRRYIALVEGCPAPRQGAVESWLKDDAYFKTYSSPTDNGGKYALTYYRTIKTDTRFSLVELRLDTGRKNQIRVHMQDIGHPICGDIKYGGITSGFNRLCLHAFRLAFRHPRTHELLRFETPFPKDFSRMFHEETSDKTKKRACETKS